MAVFLALAGHAVIIGTWQHINSAPYTVELAVVIIAALSGGLGPGILATVLSSMDLDYNCMPPYGSFVVGFDNFLYLRVHRGFAGHQFTAGASSSGGSFVADGA